MLSRIGFTIILLIGLALAAQGGAQQAASASIVITSPTDGYITVTQDVEIQGAVSVTRTGIDISMIIISVNGEAQSVPLESNGNFKMTVVLELGRNLISAIAITGNKELASARIYVTRQNPVLFFDDFEGKELRHEWAQASGTWIITQLGDVGKVLTIQEKEWTTNTFLYLKTDESQHWRDYAIELDAYNVPGCHYFCDYQQQFGIVLRALDDRNQVMLQAESDHWLCWRVIRDGAWSGCKEQVSPGLRTQQHLRIEVRGNTYVAYVNGIKRTSLELTDGAFTEGMPGLYFRSNVGAAVDNFKVESLEPGTPATAEVAQEPETPKPAEQPGEPTPTAPTASNPSASEQQSKDRLDRLEPTVSKLNSDMEATKQLLTAYDDRASNSDKEISSLKATLDSLSQEQLGYNAQFQTLTGRVTKLEGRFEELSALPAELPPGIAEQFSTIQNKLGSLEQMEMGNQQQLKTMQKQMSELQTEVAEGKNTSNLALIVGGLSAAALAALMLLRQ